MIPAQGRLVVCAPSLGDVRGQYRFLAPRLAEAGARVVTLDLRGHGESSTGWSDYSVAAVGSDLVALVRHLDAGPALLIGTSMAAGAAVWAAAEAPEQVSGLVLVGPFVRDIMPPWQAKLLFRPLFANLWGIQTWAKYYPTLYPTEKPEDFEQYLHALLENLRQPGRLAALRGMMTASKRAAEKRLERVEAPALIVMGSLDPDFKDPEAEAELVASRLNGNTLLVEGAGHYPHAEMPAEVAPAIIQFAHSVTQEAAYDAPGWS